MQLGGDRTKGCLGSHERAKPGSIGSKAVPTAPERRPVSLIPLLRGLSCPGVPSAATMSAVILPTCEALMLAKKLAPRLLERWSLAEVGLAPEGSRARQDVREEILTASAYADDDRAL